MVIAQICQNTLRKASFR